MSENIDDLRYIRSTMEKSSKFLTLSGISGVAAGCVALVGAMIAYKIVYDSLSVTGSMLTDLFILSALVLILSVALGVYFSWRKARKSGVKLFNGVSFGLFRDGGIPLVIGGVFCIILLYNDCPSLVATTMLIFYGIALIGFGARSYSDIRVLGACEILLGFIAGFIPQYGLLIWTIGFGLLHIIYGAYMYLKYDYKVQKK
ncbi:hypothetical protein E2605_02285 [Dysgonomonas capnocytophagoides]|uniref:DUF308 domain-containing protein n=1 Tax=Dysgonomonas capnocytophagoides TaxID=45254 RepID=A0A4Y8L8J0_9BACT|nr:hypothetical protein [Dysgonomonas capnocytophagoides]TFD98935.1 hypothetical protein E2605_02285 [Dysgonomonas capnocytophagoides]